VNHEEQLEKNLPDVITAMNLPLVATELNEANNPTSSIGARIVMMYHSLSDMNTRMSKYTACRNKCSHCCHQAVAVSREEAKVISHMTQAVRDDTIATQYFGEVDQKKYFNVPCVFLKNGTCSIYYNRPLMCRTHFNLTDDPSLCDTVKNPMAEVPNIDFTELISTTIPVIGTEFKDIREWFPQGLENGN